MFASFETGDRGLAHAELAGQRGLGQVVRGPVGNDTDRDRRSRHAAKLEHGARIGPPHLLSRLEIAINR